MGFAIMRMGGEVRKKKKNKVKVGKRGFEVGWL